MHRGLRLAYYGYKMLLTLVLLPVRRPVAARARHRREVVVIRSLDIDWRTRRRLPNSNGCSIASSWSPCCSRAASCC
jgi:hypothetical protein